MRGCRCVGGREARKRWAAGLCASMGVAVVEERVCEKVGRVLRVATIGSALCEVREQEGVGGILCPAQG